MCQAEGRRVSSDSACQIQSAEDTQVLLWPGGVWENNPSTQSVLETEYASHEDRPGRGREGFAEVDLDS
jgi:hypothetical protein